MPPAKRAERRRPKLMFVGKYAEFGRPREFEEFGAALGAAAAAAGAEIVVGSDSQSTLDAAVVSGAANYGREQQVRVPWRLYMADDGKSRYPRTPAGMDEPVRETFRSPTRWQAAHLEAVRAVDAVIAVGGHGNTHRACVAADAFGRSVWPVPLFGGAAQRVFLSMIGRGNDRRSRELAAASGDFTRLSWTEIAEKLILRILGVLAMRPPKPRRVYFLSYARADEAAADQVEMFLHRKGRGVIRDEIDFPPGANLEESMRQGIAASDDMVVLDSERAAGRKWVGFELAFARSLAEHDANRRILGFLLDGMPPRTALDAGALHLEAKDRSERKQAVDTATSFEPKVPKAKRR